MGSFILENAYILIAHTHRERLSEEKFGFCGREAISRCLSEVFQKQSHIRKETLEVNGSSDGAHERGICHNQNGFQMLAINLTSTDVV